MTCPMNVPPQECYVLVTGSIPAGGNVRRELASLAQKASSVSLYDLIHFLK